MCTQYDQIISLSGHHGEVWGLALSKDAEFIVTSSQDRSIRVWDRTKDQVFIEEEREAELEKLFDSTLEEGQAGLEEGQESAIATTKTLATIKAGEKLLESLEEAEKEKLRWEDHNQSLLTHKQLGKRNKFPAFQPSPVFQGKTVADYILSQLSEIPPTDIEQSLMVLSFTDVIALFNYIKVWIEKVNISFRVLYFFDRGLS